VNYDHETMMRISSLISRVLYLEDMDRTHGDHHKGRGYERDAIEWAIRELAARYPTEASEAEIVAEDRERRRQERKHGG